MPKRDPSLGLYFTISCSLSPIPSLTHSFYLLSLSPDKIPPLAHFAQNQISPGTATLLDRHRTISKLLRTLVFTRPMGSGPQTFPSGVTKWQWRHMHEKRAREKVMRSIEQEKELYKAQIWSHIKDKLSGKPSQPISPNPSTGGSPMSTINHIKALVNRFMKRAEDLWNEDDGPLKSSPLRGPNGWSRFSGLEKRRGSIGSLIELRNLVWEGQENVNLTNLNSVNSMN